MSSAFTVLSYTVMSSSVNVEMSKYKKRNFSQDQDHVFCRYLNNLYMTISIL